MPAPKDEASAGPEKSLEIIQAGPRKPPPPDRPAARPERSASPAPEDEASASPAPQDEASAGPEKSLEIIQAGPRKPPPPVTVRFFDDSFELEAWTFCYGSVCADGSPPANPPDVGSPDEVVLEFPLSGWSFEASFSPADTKCGRIQTVQAEPIGDGRFLLRPAGYADTYDVTLFGRGEGDLFTTFRWTTPTDGQLPEPEARLAVLAGHDGQVDSYGVELEARNLARTPRRASARITVRAANGDAIGFKAKRARERCLPQGTVYFDGPDYKGLAAAELGRGPFTYLVDLRLDGKRYVASATWPDDEIKGNEPSVRLDFTPNLPALSR